MIERPDLSFCDGAGRFRLESAGDAGRPLDAEYSA
jgi:hypothetical protein